MNLNIELNKIDRLINNLENEIKKLISESTDLDYKWESFISFCYYTHRGNLDSNYEFNNPTFQDFVHGKQFAYNETIVIQELISEFLEDKVHNCTVDVSYEEKLEIIKEVKEQCLRDFVYSFKYDEL